MDEIIAYRKIKNIRERLESRARRTGDIKLAEFSRDLKKIEKKLARYIQTGW